MVVEQGNRSYFQVSGATKTDLIIHSDASYLLPLSTGFTSKSSMFRLNEAPGCKISSRNTLKLTKTVVFLILTCISFQMLILVFMVARKVTKHQWSRPGSIYKSVTRLWIWQHTDQLPDNFTLLGLSYILWQILTYWH